MLNASIEFMKGTDPNTINAALEELEEMVDIPAVFNKRAGVFELKCDEEILSLEQADVETWMEQYSSNLLDFNCTLAQSFGFSISL